MAARVEADLRVITHGVIRVGRHPEQRADSRDGADLAAGRKSRQLGLGEQSNVARTEGPAGLVEVELVCGVENDEDMGPVMCRDPDDLGERARIDPLRGGGGAGARQAPPPSGASWSCTWAVPP